jgi:alkanesulfonate monooxygenase SsuD/methylene tetrahydromethanopterin reductase-like flavin-dependent oxidoreductase (luciferase family)
MLQLVARDADAWNTAWHTDPSIIKERIESLSQACAIIGRDPATIEMTVGTEVRLQPLKDDGSPDNAISGTPEEIASRLQAFASVGTSHLIVALDAVTPATIEQLGHIAEMVRKL